LDGIPSATVIRDHENKITDYHEGIPLGVYHPKNHEIILYNHLEITVLNHKVGDKYRVVGLEVEPFSFSEYKREDRFILPESQKLLNTKPQLLVSGLLMEFTYNINVVESNMEWANRMDHYTKISSHYE
jgi:hypothetical protein